MTGTTTALVGTTGGAGTTRTTVELAAMLALDGRDVAIVDAAYATQGLSHYVEGRIDTDVTSLVTECDETLDSAFVDLDLTDALDGSAVVDVSDAADVPGRVACCPAAAPFERLARAKTPEAAKQFGDRIAEAATRFDHVLVDAPPVAANQSIAAVTSVDRVVLVTPATERGADSLQQMRARLRDIGVAADATLTVRGIVATSIETDGRGDADAVVPASDVTAPGDAPACLDSSVSFAAAVTEAAELAIDDELSVGFDEERLLDAVGSYVSSRGT